MTRYLLPLFSIAYFTLISCGKKSASDSASTTSNISISAIDSNDNSSVGENYSDSLVQAMVTQTMEQNKTISIDSFQGLHNFHLANLENNKFLNLNIDTLKAFEDYSNPVSQAQVSLLNVTDLLAVINQSEHFKTYLFMDKKIESHFGPALKLISISNDSNKFYSTILAQEYHSENYNYILSTKFNSQKTFKVTKVEYFNMSNSNPEDDSISTTISGYMINSDGKFTLSK